ncbi:uncharacterized protein (DUF1501 family) [Paraburkholderia sp. Clong3]
MHLRARAAKRYRDLPTVFKPIPTRAERNAWTPDQRHISDTPDPARVEPIAMQFRASGYDIEVTLRALGENLFYPPNVKGWPGGASWINSSTLKGGNDGLNTVIPFADPAYLVLRKNIGIKREQMIQIDERTALHPALEPLMPLWRSRQLAIVQGVSYAQPNLSHFRWIEIWDTASRSDQYLRDGWLTRAFAMRPVPIGFAADGVVIGSAEMGPLANGARAIALVNPAQFVRASRLATPVSLHERNPALAPILDVENDIVKAADRLRATQGQPQLKTAFPGGAFGSSIKPAMQVLAAWDTPNRAGGTIRS